MHACMLFLMTFRPRSERRDLSRNIRTALDWSSLMSHLVIISSIYSTQGRYIGGRHGRGWTRPDRGTQR